MDEKKLFIAQMDKLIKYGRDNDNLVTREDIDEYFKDIKLDEEKKQLIINFLYDARIGVDEAIDPEEMMDEEDVDFLKMYIDELESIGKTSDKERLAIIDSFLSGDDSAKDKLIESYLWEVVETAKLYAGFGVGLEDLIGEGNVALTVIMEGLDKRSSAKETDSMISDALMSAMEELVYEDSNEKNKNNSWAQDANEVLDKAKELAETLGRNVRVEELCSFGDFEEEFVRNVLEITGGIEIIEDSVKNGSK